MKHPPEKFRASGRGVVMILIIVVIITAPLLLFRTLTGNIVGKITQTISMQYSQELNSQMSANISNSLEYFFYELNTEFNALKLVDDLDEAKLESFIADTKLHNNISYLAFGTEDGYIYDESGSYLGTMQIDMIGELLNGAKHVITDNETINGESYIMIGTSFDEPIMMGASAVSVAILGMTNDALSESVIMHSDFSGGYSSLINTDGSYIIKNPLEPFGGLNVFSILQKYYRLSDDSMEALKQAVLNEEGYFLSLEGTVSNASVYLYFAPIENTQWYAVNTLPSSFIGKNISDLQDSLSTIYITIIIILILVTIVIILQQTSAGRKLRKSQIELEKALQLAEDASNAKTAFLFNMSHDIRTPMNAILGFTDIGLTHVSDVDRAADSFRKIKTAGDHLLSLINDILEMSRIESGKLELVEQELDIRQAIDNINTMSQTLAIPKSIDLQTVIGDIQNPYIFADELHVNEIIINLISNAVKYTPNGGMVRYTINQLTPVQDGKATYRFEVSDTGIGMSEEFQKHLFEAFSREATSTVSKTEGAGLGLSIVKKIVDIAGGTITASSTVGKGSVFTLELPFRVMNEDEIKKFVESSDGTEEIQAAVSLTDKKVLLVEDNEINREIATMLLEDAGLSVETAEDGQIAVQTIAEKGMDYYDFVLMDIQMPVMNGYEATQAIRKLPDGNKVKIIALSANAFEEDKKKSVSVGMDAHVAKPIDINELFKTMNLLTK